MRRIIFCLLSVLIMSNARAQGFPKFYLNKEETSYVKFYFGTQAWTRFFKANKGTKQGVSTVNHEYDISVRRFRFGIKSQVKEKLFFYGLLGRNNLNFQTPPSMPLDILDLQIDYTVAPQFSFGGGKTGYRGVIRAANPNPLHLLALDLVPATIPVVNQTDDLLRRLSIYARGKIGILDYRVILAKPVASQNLQLDELTPGIDTSNFSNNRTRYNVSGYFSLEFGEKESTKIPYRKFNYFGTKNVLTAGIGVEYQPRSMWHLNADGDTLVTDILLLGIDFFNDTPINPIKNSVFTTYVAFMYYAFGPNYVRQLSFNNPFPGNNTAGIVPDAGNAYPSVGTGTSLVIQSGYLFGRSPKKIDRGQFQPVVMVQLKQLEAINDLVGTYWGGFNYAFNKNFSKLSFMYLNFPNDDGSPIRLVERSYSFILQYQLLF